MSFCHCWRGLLRRSGRSRLNPIRGAAIAKVTSRKITAAPDSLTALRVSSRKIAPPPNERTPTHSVSADATMRASRSRNTLSPSSMKICATLLPALSSIRVSVSENCDSIRCARFLPIALLPAPGGPISITRGGIAAYLKRRLLM